MSTARTPSPGEEAVRVELWPGAMLLRRLDDVMAVYRSAFLELHEADPHRAAAERRGYVASHLARDSARGCVALDSEGRIVGFGYACRGARGQWWHDVVSQAVGPVLSRRWLDDCLEVVELHVDPAWQQQGIGRRLLRLLMSSASERTVALSALDLSTPARLLYDSEGFQPLLTGFRFPANDPEYVVLVRDLRPEGAREAAP